MKKLFVVDDDPVMVKLLEYSLRKQNYVISLCRDGSSAREQIESEKPDLVLLDLLLPGKSGLELTKILRNDKEFTNLPIIIITRQGRESTREELIKEGANAVFTKPFSPKLLSETITQLLNQDQPTSL